MTGNAGADSYYFDTAPGAANIDRITDFSGPDDTIRLNRTIFSGIAAPGSLPASAFAQGTAAADANDRILYDSATGRIFYDADGAGGAAAILFARVTAGTVLTSADFFGYG
jgi:Ca2+-binding RTX toxin-like protein